MRSVVTRYEDYSVFSGSPAECVHHLCFGSGMRDLSEKFGLWIPCLHTEHNMSPKGLINQIHANPRAEDLSKMLGEIAFEKEYYRRQCVSDDSDPARDEFMKIFGRAYI